MNIRRLFPWFAVCGIFPLYGGFSGCSSTRSGDSGPKHTSLTLSDMPGGDRFEYGLSPWPIWSELTLFESEIVSQIPAAKSGDPKALLRLGLLASGDERSGLEYPLTASAVSGFVERTRKKFPEGISEREKAKRIFEDMHVHFFGSEAGRNLRGYDFSQSTLTGVFRDRRFNCISSAMLYLILCRHFGLDAKGVLLPGHIFVQINLADDSKVEVETTVMTGFGVIHDKAFYRSQSSWLRKLYKNAPTFASYEKRTILEPWQVILENMGNQHTDPSRMNMRDIFRLREIRSFGWPENSAYARDRLSAYSLEAAHLQKAAQWHDLLRFSGKVLPWILQIKSAHAGDSVFAMRIAVLHAAYAVSLVETGREDEAKNWADQSLASAQTGSSSHAELVQMNYAILARRWQILAGKGEFSVVELEIDHYDEVCPVKKSCPDHRLLLYSEWSQSLWKKEKWEDAVAKLKKVLVFAGDNRQKYREALDGAYSNWANFYFKNEKYGEGRKVLEKCLEESAENKNCRESMERLRQSGL